MCAENTTKVGVIAHHASGARGLAVALARTLIDNQVEIKMDITDKTTVKDMDAFVEENGVAVPSDWRKMKAPEKRTWLRGSIDKIKAAVAPAKLPAHVREKKAWDARKARQKAMVKKFGNYVTNKRMQPYIAAMNGEAPDPQPMTRQVLRTKRRKANKAALSVAKIEALKVKRPGGAAAILSAEAHV